MRRRALILGHTLAGLVTAYRLAHYGFHITVIGTHHPSPHSVSSSHQSLENPILQSTEDYSLPLILHGFYRSTWLLLQELSCEWPIRTFQQVHLEFRNEGNPPIALPNPPVLPLVHPLTRLIFFKSLSLSDRWKAISYLEKLWEENRFPKHNPDSEDAETWLSSAKQSQHARTHVWDPLCRFFLNCELSQGSLGSFMAILSRYWIGQSLDANTFLAPAKTLTTLEDLLRRLLRAKGVTFYDAAGNLQLRFDSDGIQAVECNNLDLSADVYISALDPKNFLSLLSERMLARYAYFSSLAHIPITYGQAIEFTFHNISVGPRILLNVPPYDWITSQPSTDSTSSKTLITCFALTSMEEEKLLDASDVPAAWPFIHNLLNLSDAQSLKEPEIKIVQKADVFFPCIRGTRTHRPLSQTPISNLFLTGPWVGTHLPSSIETTINSANLCASSVASALEQSIH